MPTLTSLAPAPVDDDPEAHESLHDNAVYDQIAPNFSSTRYKVRLCPGPPTFLPILKCAIA